MAATEKDYENLARAYMQATGQDPEEWEDEAIDEDNDLVSMTLETLEDFKTSRHKWNEPGKMKTVKGFKSLYWARCQALKGQRRCELTVLDCGKFRLIYQV